MKFPTGGTAHELRGMIRYTSEADNTVWMEEDMRAEHYVVRTLFMLWNVVFTFLIDSIMFEGGASLNWSALYSRIVQPIQAYIAPKFVGGSVAKTPVGGTGIDVLRHTITLRNT